MYAKTDEEIYPNNVYQMSGNQITVRTLDLNLPFDEIAGQLNTIAKRISIYKGGLLLKKKKDEVTIRSSAAEYLTYVASVGGQQDSIEMRYEEENIWLTQRMMSTLYDVGTNTINYHVKKIFSDSELQEDSVIRKFRITAAIWKKLQHKSLFLGDDYCSRL